MEIPLWKNGDSFHEVTEVIENYVHDGNQTVDGENYLEVEDSNGEVLVNGNEEEEE